MLFRLVMLFCLLGFTHVHALAPAVQRGEVCLNGDWQAAAGEHEDTLPAVEGFDTTLPVPGVFSPMYTEQPRLNFHKVWYRLDFAVPAAWQDGRRVHLDFRSVDHYGKVYVNRQAIGEHYGVVLPFQFDVTDAVKFGEDNELLVFVEDLSRTISTPEAREKALATPWSNWKKRRAVARAPNDYPHRVHMPGVSGDVYLRSTPAVFIADVFVKPSVRQKHLTVQVWVTNTGATAQRVTVTQDVSLDGEVALTLPAKTVEVPAGETIDFEVQKEWADPKLWGYGEYGSATLYFIRSELKAGNVRDTRFTRFGFREMWAEGKDFYFNGRKYFIMGDCDSMEKYVYKCTRAYIARFLQAQRMFNINNLRAGGDGPIHQVWFELGDEMGVPMQPCVGVSAFPNPTSRKNDEFAATVYTKSVRNNPCVVTINTNGEAASQGGGAISPGNDPAVWESLKLAQEAIKRVDGTRLVFHDGSPRIMLSKKYGLDFPLDVWDIHPYGDPLVNSLRRHMQEFGYDGSVPCVLGEVVGKKVSLPKDINLLKEYPEEAYNLQMLTARHWTETIRDLKAEGVGGLRVLNLLTRAWWGAASKTEVSGGPYDGRPSTIAITWPARSGAGLKPIVQVWGHKEGLTNYLLPDRPLVFENIIGKHVREAFREANGGEDLPPVPDRRVPEVIVTVTAGGKPAAGAYVYLEPRDGQATNVRGTMADIDGRAWFVLKEPGKYNASCTVDGKTGDLELQARWGSLANDPMPWGHIDRFTLAMD